MTSSEPEADPDLSTAVDQFRAVGFFPADHAASESGKVFANGAYWNVLRFPAFPAVLPAMALVAVLHQPFHATHADHTFTMTLQDSDGRPSPAVHVEGQFRATPSLESKYGEPSLLPFTVPLHGIRFETPGDFSFVFSVDGNELARYPFHVIQTFAATVPFAATPH